MFNRILLAMKLAFILMVVAFLHYNLPDRDIVRVVGTDVTRVDQQQSVLGAGHRLTLNSTQVTLPQMRKTWFYATKPMKRFGSP